jgi:hypothetical protein
VKGEICVRAYFPDPKDLPPEKHPLDITSRLELKEIEQAAFKQRWGCHVR